MQEVWQSVDILLLLGRLLSLPLPSLSPVGDQRVGEWSGTAVGIELQVGVVPGVDFQISPPVIFFGYKTVGIRQSGSRCPFWYAVHLPSGFAQNSNLVECCHVCWNRESVDALTQFYLCDLTITVIGFQLLSSEKKVTFAIFILDKSFEFGKSAA